MPEAKNSSGSPVTRLRAHHIGCLPFNIGSFAERGASFQQVESEVKTMFSLPAESKVMVIEGADELCHQCLFYDGEGKQSLKANLGS